MGRLFWKFFLFIWLAQLVGALGTGLFFWLERERFETHLAAGPPPEFRPPSFSGDGHRPPHPHGFRLPPLPALLVILRYGLANGWASGVMNWPILVTISTA